MSSKPGEGHYARLGVGYIALVLGWLGFLGLAGGMLSAVVASRLLGQSFRPPLDLVLMVEVGIAVGNGISLALINREARPLVTWIRGGRTQGAAAGAWQAGVTLIRRELGLAGHQLWVLGALCKGPLA